MDRPRVCFLGLGLLGSALAEAEALRGRSAVCCWNRSQRDTTALVAAGATVASSPQEAVRGAVRVHMVLASDDSVDAVVELVRPALAPGAVLIDHTTTAPARTAARAQQLRDAGITFLHAPVFMAPANARAATGTMMACGPRAVYDAMAPALAAMTGKLEWLGPLEDTAAVKKLMGNALLIPLNALLADVLSIGHAHGLDARATLLDLLHTRDFSAFMAGKVEQMARGVHDTPTFELVMARKDVGLMVDAAHGQPLVVLPAVAAAYDAHIAQGHGKLDQSVLAQHVFPQKKPSSKTE